MKQEFDKEIDSLLRRSAQLAAAGPRHAAPSRAPFESSHLDADELSAFAENALPSAARLAAASHLADCDECRGMVVQLAGAADTAGEIEKRAAPAPVIPVEIPWWKSLLGVAFAPRVLRYAAPVLVLGLVGVVSFIALRTRQGSVPATVYQNEGARDAGTTTSTGAGVETAPTGAAQPTNTGTNANTTASTTSPVVVPGGVLAPPSSQTDKESAVNRPVVVAEADRDVASAADRAAPVEMAKKSGPVAEGEARREDAFTVNSAPAPAPPPAKATASEVNEQPKGARGADLARNKEQPEEPYVYNERAQQENRVAQTRNRQGEVQMPDGGARNDTRAMNNQRGNVGGGYPAPSTRAERSAASRRGRAEDSKARDSAGEDGEAAPAAGAKLGDRDEATRSVAGRRFRREGGAWVDANYKPSMSMTAVRRGTDGYRALVADIPELGRIAEQLGGEVIAVVKGRAYRIR